MRYSLAIAAVLAFVATGAVAQAQNPPAQTQNPPAKDGPQNSAINSPDSSNRQVTAPVSGRNSFTEGEAKSRIEKMGFSNVTNLKKDDNGVWRGRAIKDGKNTPGKAAIFARSPGYVLDLSAEGSHEERWFTVAELEGLPTRPEDLAERIKRLQPG